MSPDNPLDGAPGPALDPRGDEAVRTYLRDVLAAGEAEQRLELRRRWHAGRGTVPKITSPPLIAIPPFTPRPSSPPADTGRPRAEEWRALQSVWRSSAQQTPERLLPMVEDLQHSHWPDIRQQAARTLAVLRAKPQIDAAWPSQWPDALRPVTFLLLVAPWAETEGLRDELSDTFFGPLGSFFQVNDFTRQLKSLLPEVDPGHIDRTLLWLKQQSQPSQASANRDPDFLVSASGRDVHGNSTTRGFPWVVIVMFIRGFPWVVIVMSISILIGGSRLGSAIRSLFHPAASVRFAPQNQSNWPPLAPPANSAPPQIIQLGPAVPPDLPARSEFNTNPQTLADVQSYAKLQKDVKALQDLVTILQVTDKKPPDFQAHLERSLREVEQKIRAALAIHPPDSEWSTRYADLLWNCQALRQLIDRQ